MNALPSSRPQLKQAEVNAAEPAAGMVELEEQLQAVVAERDAKLAEHEVTVATLREHLADRNRVLAEKEAAESEGEPDRVAELEAELTSLREELADRDRQLAERPAEHEPTTVGLRALVENVEHEAMTGLREDLADRDRRLAENVNEIARLNRELAESAEREAAMTSLRSELDDRGRQLAERAMLVENVEHDAMTALRNELSDRERQIARTRRSLPTATGSWPRSPKRSHGSTAPTRRRRPGCARTWPTASDSWLRERTEDQSAASVEE